MRNVYQRFATALHLVLFPALLFAQEANKTHEAQSGGAILEYPRGRFQENAPPDFFKWSLVKPAHSVSLKVFRTDEEGHYDPNKDLITRYEFLSKIQSATWTRDSFPKGSYVWTIEMYDEQSSNPNFKDTAKFLVEPLRHYNLKTVRMGALVGFSRGIYRTEEHTSAGTYKVEYDTTPTSYGVTTSGGDEEVVWDAKGYLSDFILRGSVQRTMNIYGSYLYRLKNWKFLGAEYYAGPTFRIYQFPRTLSVDDTNLTTDRVTLAYPGASLIAQKRFDLHVTLFSQLNLGLPVMGTETVKIKADDLSYSVHGGMIYGLFWPIGFSGEIFYKVDQSTTQKSGNDIKTYTQDWGVTANLLYAF